MKIESRSGRRRFLASTHSATTSALISGMNSPACEAQKETSHKGAP